MEHSSKKGAALAYVIMMSAVLLILASGLIIAANNNIGYSQNSLEGRQAYLDAKSAIEYGKAYIKENPDTCSFYISKNNNSGPGYKIVPKNKRNAIAVYDSKEKTLNAAGKYKSSNRVRRLGFKFKESTQENPVEDFIVAGPYLGGTNIYNFWTIPFMEENVSCPYPVFVNNTLDIVHNSIITTPKLMLMGTNLIENILDDMEDIDDMFDDKFDDMFDDKYKSNSIMFFSNRKFIINSDAIYINSNIYAKFGGELILNSITKGKDGIIVFLNDCTIYGNRDKTIEKGCYSFENGINLIDNNELKDGLKKLDKIPDYAKINQRILDNPKKVISGDTQTGIFGAYWSSSGKINWYNYPNYSLNILNHEKIIYETDFNIFNYKNKIIYWYINDVSGWDEVLWGDNNKKNEEYFLDMYNVYPAKELYVRYVSRDDFIVPQNKTVVFKADKITLSMGENDKDTNGLVITHKGNDAQLILEAQNEKDKFTLYVPYPVKVKYKSNKNSYSISTGFYEVSKIDLFSREAEQYFNETVPQKTPEETEITGGVYTNGF